VVVPVTGHLVDVPGQAVKAAVQLLLLELVAVYNVMRYEAMLLANAYMLRVHQ
jgi:hypothetical protein